jgi:hypothetical protein
MDMGWLDADAICEGRLLNTVGASLLTGVAGASAGYVGGSILRTRCIGNGEAAAVRGAIAGAGIGAVAGVLTRHISARALARKNAEARARAQQNPIRPWSWRDVRPAVTAIGAIAAGGALIGVSQGMRAGTDCGGGAAGGAARGAAVYGGGAAVSIVGSLLVVRFLF